MDLSAPKPLYFVLPPFFADKNISVQSLQKLNPNLILEEKKQNYLQIFEKTELQTEYIGLLVEQNFSEQEFELLQDYNNELRFENVSNQLLLYKSMGGLISAITAIVIASFITWAMSKKRGRVYGEDADYKLPNPENEDEILWRKADVSFISYDSVTEQKQDTFNKAIPVPPDLAIEIVSARYGLTPALWKIEFFWLKTGVKLGLVICPFSKKIYIFEKTKKYEQSIYLTFTHPLLPNYVGDFSTYVDKIT